jgi:hypothetical protein
MVFVALLVGILSLLGYFFPQKPGTESERAARKETVARQKEIYTRQLSLCKIHDACTFYARARSDCAVAGDFNKCLSIKLDSIDANYSLCANDGSVPGYELEMPNMGQCLVLELSDKIH